MKERVKHTSAVSRGAESMSSALSASIMKKCRNTVQSLLKNTDQDNKHEFKSDPEDTHGLETNPN